MKLIPQISLAFDGQCEAAFRFYERCLDGSITYTQTWGESPMAARAPEGWSGKIAHATLKVGDTAFLGSDVPANVYKKPQGFSIILQMDDPAAAERVFNALAEKASVDMPLQQTYWARRFATFVDQFGISWSINCE